MAAPFTDLADFLRARIHADQVVARDALEDWVEGEDGDEMAGRVDSILVGAHMVRWNPKRVLDDCDGKLKIIEEYRKEAWVMAQGHQTGWTQGGQAVRETVLQLWARPYADHEAYREEWR